MLLTIKTEITFRLPKEKALMEEFETKNTDWVKDDSLSSQWHYTESTTSATFKRTDMVEIGADWKGGNE